MTTTMDTTEVAPLRQLLETERAKAVLTSTQSFLQSYYGKAKDALPASAVERLSSVEDVVAKRVTAEAVTGVIDSLDSAIASINTKVVETQATINTKVVETRATINTKVVETSDRALALRKQAVDAADSTVTLQITRLERVFDSILPAAEDESADEADEKDEKDEKDEVVATTTALPRMIKLSSRISKRLQKRALKNLTVLRERAETVQHVDLIQYAADYLDLDEKETRQRIATARDFVTEKAQAVYEPVAPVVGRVQAATKDVTAAVDARRAAVVAHARSFYALLAVEYIKIQQKTGAKLQDAESFALRVKAQLGASWNDRFAAPTKTYFNYISTVWAETAAAAAAEGETKTDKTEDGDAENKSADMEETRLAALQAKIAEISEPAVALSSHVDRFLRVITPQVNAAVGDAVKSLSERVKGSTTAADAAADAAAPDAATSADDAVDAGSTKTDEEEDEDL